MPELPEVETTCRGLAKAMPPGSEISEIKLLRKDLRWEMPKAICQAAKGAVIQNIHRRAKYILIETDRGTILSHLGMSGSWRIVNPNSNAEHDLKHDHVQIYLNDQTQFIYHDPRRFGMFDWIAGDTKNQSQHFLLKDLGPEPLDTNAFSAEYLHQTSRNKTVAVKNYIMNQKVVVGVGNIYASEALYLAKVRPTRRAGKLTMHDCENLVLGIYTVLQAALKSGGSTIRDYRSTDGAGSYQSRLQVYGRTGQPCPVCDTPIQEKVLGARSTFWCKSCQR